MIIDALLKWMIEFLLNRTEGLCRIQRRRAARVVKDSVPEFDLSRFSDEDIIDGLLDCVPVPLGPSDVHAAIQRRSARHADWPDVIGL